MTQGLELEAKFRASDLLAERAAHRRARQRERLPLARRRACPGPTTGSTSSPTTPPTSAPTTASPACRSRSAATSTGRRATRRGCPTCRRPRIGRKLVIDAYALWTFNPALQLRLSLSNLDPHDYVTGSSVDGPDRQGIPVRETSRTTQPTLPQRAAAAGDEAVSTCALFSPSNANRSPKLAPPRAPRADALRRATR